MKSPYRRTDGTFGVDAEVVLETVPDTGTGPGNGKPFSPGHPKYGGRSKGRKNRVRVELAELAAEMPAGAPVAASERLPGDGRTREPLQVLEWAMLHPRASLQLIVLAADKLASYKYAKKKDVTNHFDDALIEAINEKLRAGRARAARGVHSGLDMAR